MLEQIDHRGKRFTIGDEDGVDDSVRNAVSEPNDSNRRRSERSVNSNVRKPSLDQTVRIPTLKYSNADTEHHW